MTFIWILFVIIWLIIFTAALGGWSAAPWVPTKKSELEMLINNIDINPGSTVYDLGCGTGTILFALAEKYPNAKYIGFEISLVPYWIAKYKAAKLNGELNTNIEIRYSNLFKQNLRNADVVVVFLLEKAYKRLQKKFAKELKHDCLVIIQAWRLKNIEPREVISKNKLLSFFTYKGSDFK